MDKQNSGYSLEEREARNASLAKRDSGEQNPVSELMDSNGHMDDAAPHWQAFYHAVRQAVEGMRGQADKQKQEE